MAFLIIEHLTKTYPAETVPALRDVSLAVAAGEVVALMGPSGCGKSTLLNILGSLDRPSGGSFRVAGKTLAEWGALHLFRARTVGFVFQFHHLVSTMTLAENVSAPLVALGIGRRRRLEQACELLREVGLEHRAGFFPNKVSGGERQRAAIARALIAGPQLLLADEPTGNLDSASGEAAVRLMIAQCRQRGATAVIATHNQDVAARADRIIMMRDGAVVPAGDGPGREGGSRLG